MTSISFDDLKRPLDEARALVLGAAISRDPAVRAQGLYLLQMLQAFGFNIYVAPRQAYPNFYLHSIFMPFESGFGAPCPDFFYRWAFLDGQRRYRITGRVGTTRWIEFQTHKGFWGDPDQGHLGNHDLDAFTIGADGRFEVIASATKVEGNWIPLDAGRRNIVLMVREAWYDWAHETGAEFHIEAIGLKGDEPMALDEAEMMGRSLAVSRLVKFYVEFFLALNQRITDGVGINQFFFTPPKAANHVGGNPRAGYMQMVYDIALGEALIVETEIPDARYWSIQMNDLWWQTTDYAHHQSSLNGHQARRDADGRVRMVLSREDPGVPNWIDPVNPGRGIAQWRWYLSDRHPVPAVKKVALAQLREHLPADTPHVSAEQRREAIAGRKRAVLSRYGF